MNKREVDNKVEKNHWHVVHFDQRLSLINQSPKIILAFCETLINFLMSDTKFIFQTQNYYSEQKQLQQLYYNRVMRVWGTCARTEGGVFTYLSRQSEDHCPKTLMSQGGKLAEAAVVAAPLRKL